MANANVTSSYLPWLEEWRERASKLPYQPGATLSVHWIPNRQEPNSAIEATFTFVDGCLDRSNHSLASSHLFIRANESILEATLSLHRVSEEDLGSIRIAVEDSPSPKWWPLPPLDEIDLVEFGEMPEIIGGDVKVQSVFTGSPWGEIHFITNFTNGRPTKSYLGWDDSCDVFLRIALADLIGLRNGTVTFLDAMHHGNIGGTTAMISLVAGLVDSRGYRSGWRAAFRAPQFERYCSITSTDEYQELRNWVTNQLLID